MRISLDNNGFFAPGQEVLWGLSAVAEWIKCVYDPSDDDFAENNLDGTRGGVAGAERTEKRRRAGGPWWVKR